jgi:hypothetical protein
MLKFIATAKSEGATVVCGGARPEVQSFACTYKYCHVSEFVMAFELFYI